MDPSLRLMLLAGSCLILAALAPFLCIGCSRWVVRALQIVFAATLVAFALALPLYYGYIQWWLNNIDAIDADTDADTRLEDERHAVLLYI